MASSAPFIGLFGTVWGIMNAFRGLANVSQATLAQVAPGIAEALIATTFGLGIAVTALIPLNFLHSKCEKARHEIEDAMSHLELLMKPIMEKETAQRRSMPNAAEQEGSET